MCRVALVTYKKPDRTHIGSEPVVTSALIRNLLPLVEEKRHARCFDLRSGIGASERGAMNRRVGRAYWRRGKKEI
jgi:hypothetical protein